MRVKCLSCDAENDALATGGYCESCGKKLPNSAQVKTRKTLGGEMPGQAEATPVPARSKAVSEGLFAAAIVHLFAGGLFLILGPMLYSKVPDRFAPVVMTWTVVPPILLAVLGVLARWVPMPAVWVAVVLAVAWVGVTFFVNDTLAAGWLLVDATLFGLLGWAAWLGLRPEEKRAAS